MLGKECQHYSITLKISAQTFSCFAYNFDWLTHACYYVALITFNVATTVMLINDHLKLFT